MRRLAAVLTILTSLSVTNVLAGDPPQNDAGTGMDASDLRAAPTTLAAFGSYAGAIRSHDQDWFAVATPDAATAPWCARATAGGDTESWVWLGLRGAASDRGVAALLGNGTALTLAGAGVVQTYVGVEPVVNPATNEATRPGAYAFTFSGSGPSGGADAGTGRDAGSILSGALAIPDGCTSGRLDPMGGVGDTMDTYAFSGVAGQQVVYSLGATTSAVTLQLRNEAGTWAGPEIGTNGVAAATLPEAGSYRFAVTQAGGTAPVSYVLGAMGLDPTQNPCRPTCMTAMTS